MQRLPVREGAERQSWWGCRSISKAALTSSCVLSAGMPPPGFPPVPPPGTMPPAMPPSMAMPPGASQGGGLPPGPPPFPPGSMHPGAMKTRRTWPEPLRPRHPWVTPNSFPVPRRYAPDGHASRPSFYGAAASCSTRSVSIQGATASWYASSTHGHAAQGTLRTPHG